MAKNFKDLNTVDAKDMTIDQAKIYLLNFFNSRMMALSEKNVTKARQLINIYQINTYELVEKYVELVYHNS